MGNLAAPVRADKEMMFTNRQLVALMWPLLLEQLLAITVGLADSLMVATVGDAAISAVDVCGDWRIAGLAKEPRPAPGGEVACRLVGRVTLPAAPRAAPSSAARCSTIMPMACGFKKESQDMCCDSHCSARAK